MVSSSKLSSKFTDDVWVLEKVLGMKVENP